MTHDAAGAPRRILLCTVGGTPAVVTETLWALLYDLPQPWRPDRIEIIGTRHALEDVRVHLMRGDGPLASLFPRDRFPAGAPPLAYYAPRRESACGAPALVWNGGAAPQPAAADASDLLADVTTPEDAVAMGDLIKERIWVYVRDDETTLHVSLAGGRKTMSAHAMLALSLLGRPQDEASHVLVHGEGDENPYENNKEFWHPRQGGTISTRQPGVRADPSRAKVRLLDIPIALADELPLDRAHIAQMSLAQITRELKFARDVRIAPSLVLDAADRSVRLCGRETILSARLFFDLLALAYACIENWSAPGRPGEKGGVSAETLRLGGKTEFDPVVRRLAPLWRLFRSEIVVKQKAEPTFDEDGATMKDVARARAGSLDAETRMKIARKLVGDFKAFIRLRDELAKKFGLAATQCLLTKTLKSRKGAGDASAQSSEQMRAFTALRIPADAITIKNAP